MDGILIIDKPPDWSSAQVVASLKRLSHAKKAGHTGILDPYATGIMICCLNRATRLSRFFLEGNKSYEAILCLGIETDTQDFTGKKNVVMDPQNITDAQIEAAFKQCIGQQEQSPPLFSALKHEGTPLYKLARKGIFIQKPPRTIHIYSLHILEIHNPYVRFQVSCSTGTYIRTLCNHLGKLLGCGAHLTSLKRTESCGFTMDDAVSMETISAYASRKAIPELLINMADALRHLPEYIANEDLLQKIANGKPVNESDGLPMTKKYLKVVDTQNHLHAVLMCAKDNQYHYCCVFNESL
ncbi:MAG: tRNA pseudouridine(55) synthase TruB [Desulfobacterales bacterium]|nr:tRNA pseudouridine(55) synthase TruB [Desulfobacterales bacterium]